MIDVRGTFEDVQDDFEYFLKSGKINEISNRNKVNLFLKYTLSALDEIDILHFIIRNAVAKNSDFNKEIIEESVCGWIKKKFGIEINFEKVA